MMPATTIHKIIGIEETQLTLKGGHSIPEMVKTFTTDIDTAIEEAERRGNPWRLLYAGHDGAWLRAPIEPKAGFGLTQGLAHYASETNAYHTWSVEGCIVASVALRGGIGYWKGAEAWNEAKWVDVWFLHARSDNDDLDLLIDRAQEKAREQTIFYQGEATLFNGRPNIEPPPLAIGYRALHNWRTAPRGHGRLATRLALTSLPRPKHEPDRKVWEQCLKDIGLVP